jgi:hypothetical protein
MTEVAEQILRKWKAKRAIKEKGLCDGSREGNEVATQGKKRWNQ